jgi:hypothetical protein
VKDFYFKENFIQKLKNLHYFHYENSPDFKKIIDSLNLHSTISSKPEDIFLHTSLFKNFSLKTKNTFKEEITLYSSGTSGNQSKIHTDRLTRIEQQRTLHNLINKELGFCSKNKPSYYVIESPTIVNERKMDARYAAIKGFSTFSKRINFLLDENYEINYSVLNQLASEENSIFIFGFTAYVYLYFLKTLKEKNFYFNNKDITLLHGGGWKKLQNKGISNDKFKHIAKSVFPNVICKNYYGMIEQTGSIFFECKSGFLHSNDYGSIVIRDNNLKQTPFGVEGVIQSISTLPKSYPGHSLLTEDIGVVYGIDTCSCGQKGLYFKVKGRLSKSAVRGCSDVY